MAVEIGKNFDSQAKIRFHEALSSFVLTDVQELCWESDLLLHIEKWRALHG